MKVNVCKPSRKNMPKVEVRTKARGFQVATGIRAGNMLQNLINTIPPTLRSYG